MGMYRNKTNQYITLKESSFVSVSFNVNEAKEFDDTAAKKYTEFIEKYTKPAADKKEELKEAVNVPEDKPKEVKEDPKPTPSKKEPAKPTAKRTTRKKATVKK